MSTPLSSYSAQGVMISLHLAGYAWPARVGRGLRGFALFPVAGHCYSATAIRGQLARDMFQDFVEHVEGEIRTVS